MAKFPTTVWDGFTGNPLRLNRNQESEPSARDWDSLVNELLAVQTYLKNDVRELKFSQVAGAISVATDVSSWIYVPAACTIISVSAMLKTAPVGSSAIFDIYYSTNGGANFTTIWSTTGNRIAILAAAHLGTQTAFDVIALPAGTILRLDVTQVGSGTAGSVANVALQTTRP